MVEAAEAKDWPRASDWLASGSASGSEDRDLVVAGVPLTSGAVTPSRYDQAPSAIRTRLAKLSTYHSERDVNLASVRVLDVGDSLSVPALADARLTILLGGHNGVTWLALSACPSLASWGLLTLDAHHDVRPYAAGSVGNGSPVRALIDAGLPGSNVVQVGIHGFSNSPVHRAWCEQHGVTVLGPDRVNEVPIWLDRLASHCDAVYVDLDVDVLDRAFAPGCPGARPGGLSPRQLFNAAFTAGAHPSVRAVDIVEVDPTADVASITVDTAALCLLNVAAGFATRD
jgi:formiminoglutamase